MAASSCSLTFLIFYIVLILFIRINNAKNSLAPNEVLRNGQTLVSSNNQFKLGFFNVLLTGKPNLDSWYLGIWYNQIETFTVVWVANREKPLNVNGSKLVFSPYGDLVVQDNKMNVIYLARLNQQFHSLNLLDSGNLVILKDGKYNDVSDEGYLWQSFDFPSDTLLPGMKLGLANNVLTSWRMTHDPSLGDFVLRMDSPESPQLLLEKSGMLVPQSRWGPWDGKGFGGTNYIADEDIFRFVFHSGCANDTYFTFETSSEDSGFLRLVVNSVGSVQFLRWRNCTVNPQWIPMVTLNKDTCDGYEACGPYAICNDDNDQSSHCPEGFHAKSPNDWRSFDFSDGCVREFPLNCRDDGFMKLEGVKMPDNFTVRMNLSPNECEDFCFKDCTCMAYTTIDVYGNGSKCITWSDRLVDIRDYDNGGGNIYIRIAHAELDSIDHSNKIRKIAMICTFLTFGLWLGTLFCYVNWDLCCHDEETRNQGNEMENNETVQVQIENQKYIQMFDKCTISAATNEFSLANKIGEGGFGPVYQGELPNGNKIAVKKLSKNSNQGFREFKNEVKLIAQLQHRNLIKLLGFCIHEEERMLVYEYMHNNSLDKLIFDAARKSLLTWEKRFNILKGIARGLDYLHLGSRLRIIHRDLKTGNILLDDLMNPKISDFGLATNLETEREESAKGITGTRGYMPPEYVQCGHFSIKSDVYSFGVLSLEIISGKKNWGFRHDDHELNLLGHTWLLWVDGRELEVKDPILDLEQLMENEISRCIQIALLCVQKNPDDRPTMAQVICMLENEDVNLANPHKPGFYNRTTAGEVGSSREWKCETNGLTITTITGRT